MTGRRMLERPWLLLGTALVVAVAFSALWLVRSVAPFRPDPEPIPQGSPAATSQGTFTLRGMTTIDVLPDGGDGTPPLAGASLVAVLFDYAGNPGEEVVCLVELLGQERYWTTDRYASVQDWGYQSSCEGNSGTVLRVFEIPADAVGEIRGVRIRGGGDDVILAGEVTVQ
ncbi:MAG: hypothetical protein LCH76_05645 [Actinobacteria bacterium]|nr:hypothetical protein [Actinomycetota bacterium]